MKTLMIVTGGLGSGGLERISCFVANKFVEKGWKVVVLTLLQLDSDKGAFQNLNDNVDVVYFNGDFEPSTNKIKAIKYWRKMIKTSAKQYKPDSILSMTFKVGSMVCLFAPKYARKVTIREISDPKSKVRSQFVNKMTEIFCRKAKNIIFQTNWERSCFGKRIQSKGVVIPNPLSIKVENYGKHNEKRIFTLTRLTLEQKRQDILIKGFELFSKTHPDYTLEIYGRGEDEEKIKKLINESECKDKIVLNAPRPKIHDAVLNSRCFAITSDFEGMSNALLECYSLGIPCISSDWPGVEDIITDGEDGLIYKRQDVEEFAKLLGKVADNDELCERLSKNSVARSDRFNQEDILNRYCEVIEHE